MEEGNSLTWSKRATIKPYSQPQGSPERRIAQSTLILTFPLIYFYIYRMIYSFEITSNISVICI
jgi:hypothetical protein